MQVAIVPFASSIETWSKNHPKCDIKKIETISHLDCGITMTDYAIYYEEGVIIGGDNGNHI